MSLKPAIQLWLPFGKKGERVCVDFVTESPSEEVQLMERVVEQDNMRKAYQHVKVNGGSPGIDGMTVQELGPYLRGHWLELREALLGGTYEPQPLHSAPNRWDEGYFSPLALEFTQPWVAR